jgi:cytochrome c oxidase accessory protein FixG
MWVERTLEGDRNQRMRRDASPMSFDTAWRKILKHVIWLGVAFWTGGAWIMYYLDAPTIVRSFWEGTASSAVYSFTFLFTATTYVLAGWAREQVCTFMCPWPRFQSAMLDEQSLIVTYQAWRGESRGHLKAAVKPGETRGDCIDCGSCVTACPMGIDIREGSQLECIGCGLCIDACDLALNKVRRPTGLIAWDNLEGQAAKARGETKGLHFFRPRTVIYLCAMSVAMTVMAIAMSNRATIGLSVQQDRAPLFVRLADGTIRDGYTVKITNKTHEAALFDLDVSGMDGAALALADKHTEQGHDVLLPVGQDQVGSYRVLVTAPDHGAESTPIVFTLRNTTTGEQTAYHGVFLGPAGSRH